MTFKRTYLSTVRGEMLSQRAETLPPAKVGSMASQKMALNHVRATLALIQH
jgi:hypothetical protein